MIDELDKSSYDLPNDLLHVFEEAKFVIPELSRDEKEHKVHLHDGHDRIELKRGNVQCGHHPIIVIKAR